MLSVRLSLLSLLLACGQVWGQVQLDRFYPPAVGSGTETTVKGEGKFPSWPTAIVCDRDDVTLTAEKESGQFKVVVAADAAPGVAWIRLHDQKSASKLMPLLIEPIAPTPESEPNNGVGQTKPINLPSVIVGRLEKRGDLDSFRVQLKAGQQLVVSCLAHRILGSPMDAVVQLADDRGNVILQADDDHGLDPILNFRASEDREVVVRIFAFPETPNSTIGYAGGNAYVYAMRLTTGGLVDHVIPLLATPQGGLSNQVRGWNLGADLVPKRRTATGVAAVVYADGSLGWQWQGIGPPRGSHVLELADHGGQETDAVSVPCVLSGHILREGEIDRFRLLVKKGTKYRVKVHARKYGSPLDSMLRIVGPDGKSLADNDDQARNVYDASLEFTAPDDSAVELQISDLVDGFGPRHAYSIVVETAAPQLSMTLAEDHYAVKPEASVEIPVSIARGGGFDKKLQIAATGLPAGVTAEPVVSENKGGSAKSVKLKLTAGKEVAFQGEIQVVATVLGDGDKPTEQTYVAHHPLRSAVPIERIWLTVGQ